VCPWFLCTSGFFALALYENPNKKQSRKGDTMSFSNSTGNNPRQDTGAAGSHEPTSPGKISLSQKNVKNFPKNVQSSHSAKIRTQKISVPGISLHMKHRTSSNGELRSPVHHDHISVRMRSFPRELVPKGGATLSQMQKILEEPERAKMGRCPV
jgi:hypothetical protein